MKIVVTTLLAVAALAGMLLLTVTCFASVDMLLSQNLGEAAYRASSSWPTSPPKQAFDGDFTTQWNSGGHAPDWLEVDLGDFYQLSRFILGIEQTPSGSTKHEIWVSDSPIGDDTSGALLCCTIQQYTVDGEVLEIPAPFPIAGRYVQIRTLSSPSWVAWNEVQVYGGPEIISVAIDIKPGQYPNRINLRSNAIIPVAVLTTPDFNAAAVDPATVTLADAMPERGGMCDVDRDGDLDLLLHFRARDLNLTPYSTEAFLIGTTSDGFTIEGSDTVESLP